MIISQKKAFLYFCLIEQTISKNNTPISLLKNPNLEIFTNENQDIFTILLRTNQVESIKNDIIRLINPEKTKEILLYSNLEKQDPILHNFLYKALSSEYTEVKSLFLNVVH